MRINKHYNFFSIKDKWKKLYEGNNELSAYQSDEYAEIAYLNYFPYAIVLRLIPVFIEVIDCDKTIMIIPLCKYILKNEYILFGYKSTYGYIDFIYCKDIGHDKIQECFWYLNQALKGNKLSVNRLRDDSLICKYLLQNYQPEAIINCVHIDLFDSYDAYLVSLKKNWRHHIRTAYHRIEAEQKVVSLKMYYKQPLPYKELSKMIDLYAIRRKSRYGHNEGMLYKMFLKKYDICTIAMKKLNNCVHFILYIDDVAVAFCNGFISYDESTIILSRLAIDIKYNKFSPGILLLNESIKKIYELGIANKVDLIHGDERYKYEMGGKTHHCYEFNLLF